MHHPVYRHNGMGSIYSVARKYQFRLYRPLHIAHGCFKCCCKY